jgi:hypothetical protein
MQFLLRYALQCFRTSILDFLLCVCCFSYFGAVSLNYKFNLIPVGQEDVSSMLFFPCRPGGLLRLVTTWPREDILVADKLSLYCQDYECMASSIRNLDFGSTQKRYTKKM